MEAAQFLSALGVPTIRIPLDTGPTYFLTYSLETALFWILLPRNGPETRVDPTGWMGQGPSVEAAKAPQTLAGAIYGAVDRETVFRRIRGLIEPLRKESKRAAKSEKERQCRKT